jgi:hypothetical protein
MSEIVESLHRKLDEVVDQVRKDLASGRFPAISTGRITDGVLDGRRMEFGFHIWIPDAEDGSAKGNMDLDQEGPVESGPIPQDGGDTQADVPPDDAAEQPQG